MSDQSCCASCCKCKCHYSSNSLHYNNECEKLRRAHEEKLIHLVEYGDLDEIKKMLNEFDDIDFIDGDGNDPVFAACYRDDLEVAKVVLSKYSQINRIFEGTIDMYHDLASYNRRMCPIDLAISNDNFELVELLLRNRAEINPCKGVFNDSNTLTYAYQNSLKIYKLLLDYGACPRDRARFSREKNNSNKELKVLLGGKSELEYYKFLKEERFKNPELVKAMFDGCENAQLDKCKDLVKHMYPDYDDDDDTNDDDTDDDDD